jgi:NADPH:quinone reductase-like Zn-dependent oxidoreductase
MTTPEISIAATTGTMRAVVRDRYGAPAEVMKVGEVAVPGIAADEVLVRVRAAGVDRGVWHVVTGLPYPLRLAGFGLRAPKNPVVGSDLAGVVAAIGGSVTRFRVGDEVYGTGNGTYAEHARAAESRCHPSPRR